MATLPGRESRTVQPTCVYHHRMEARGSSHGDYCHDLAAFFLDVPKYRAVPYIISIIEFVFPLKGLGEAETPLAFLHAFVIGILFCAFLFDFS